MKENLHKNLRSEEIGEVISHKPGMIVRYGMMFLFILFICLILGSWVIQYPDILKAKVTITTTPSPINLVVRNAGNLILLKKENDPLHEGDLIGYIKAGVRPGDVLKLEQLLNDENNTQTILSTNYQLGDLQVYFNRYITAQKNLNTFRANDIETRQIEHLLSQKQSYELLNKNQKNQYNLILQESTLAKEKYFIDSTLLARDAISKVEFNASKVIYIQQQRSVKNAEAAIINNDLLIKQLDKTVAELSATKLSNSNTILIERDNQRKELLSQIKSWKKNYLFISPGEGRLAFLAFLESEQYIENGTSIFSIIPSSKNIYARAELPITGSGKVKVGQSVNIRLSNYPYEQFGMLTGKIKEISLLPNQDNYYLKIELPNGMVSSYNKHINFKQQLQGETEIITEDVRLLQRVFYQFTKLLQAR